MAVSYQSNVKQVENSMDNATGIAIRMMMENVHRLSTPITPKNTGHLRTAVTKRMVGNSRGEMIWEAPYAIYQENPRQVFNYTTPGTQGHFVETSVNKMFDQNFGTIISQAFGGIK